AARGEIERRNVSASWVDVARRRRRVGSTGARARARVLFSAFVRLRISAARSRLRRAGGGERGAAGVAVAATVKNAIGGSFTSVGSQTARTFAAYSHL